MQKKEYSDSKKLELPADNNELHAVLGNSDWNWCTDRLANDDEVILPADTELQICYFRCLLGYYNLEFGEAILFSCKATDDRLESSGESQSPVSCSGITCHKQHFFG